MGLKHWLDIPAMAVGCSPCGRGGTEHVERFRIHELDSTALQAGLDPARERPLVVSIVPAVCPPRYRGKLYWLPAPAPLAEPAASPMTKQAPETPAADWPYAGNRRSESARKGCGAG